MSGNRDGIRFDGLKEHSRIVENIDKQNLVVIGFPAAVEFDFFGYPSSKLFFLFAKNVFDSFLHIVIQTHTLGDQTTVYPARTEKILGNYWLPSRSITMYSVN